MLKNKEKACLYFLKEIIIELHNLKKNKTLQNKHFLVILSSF